MEEVAVSRENLFMWSGATPWPSGSVPVCWTTASRRRDRFVRRGNVTGDSLNTAPDRNSIMASTGYCQLNANLSLWDAVGSMSQYGKQVTGISPLVSAYNGARGDHGTMSSATGIASMRGASYNFAYPDGWVFDVQVPGTVPLKLYWHSRREDNYSTATSAGETSAISAGYSFVRVEGYVYPSPQPGTVPLKLFWHAGRGDNFTTTTAAGEAAALTAGYSFVRNEGWIFQNVPYSTLGLLALRAWGQPLDGAEFPAFRGRRVLWIYRDGRRRAQIQPARPGAAQDFLELGA
jgi:hypothetical protein